MRNRIQYFSTYDMSISYYLQNAEEIIEKYHKGWRPEDVNDVIELYNIWLFVNNGIYMKSWSENTLNEIKGYKDVIIPFFSKLNESTWVEVYKQVDFSYRHNFWEIIDRFNIKSFISKATLDKALLDNSYDLRYLLQRERLVKKNNELLAALLKENEHTAEWLLSEFVEDDKLGNHEHMYFPSALTLQDREYIISAYLDLPEPNLNYVRLVLVAKKDSNLRLSDDVILKATNVERELNNKFFNEDNTVHFKYSVRLSGESNKPLKWVEYDEEGDAILCYSKPIMLGFKDVDLLHYCRYGFEFLTYNGMVSLVSKVSQSSVFERTMGLTGKYSYTTNMAFRYNEAISMLQIEAMQNALENEGRNIESAIKVFYETYLKEEFGYPSTALSLPDPSADWVSKCRIIAPEIDAVAKRYNLFAKRGSVDDDLLQISSDTVRVSGTTSCNHIKYYTIKGQPGELYRLFHLLFSDQSMLSFVEPFKDKHYGSFFQMLAEQDGKIPYDNYAQYQLRDIDYLIGEGYLSKNEDGKLFVEKKMEIGLLKQLYEYHSCPMLAYGAYGQEILQEMADKGWLEEDNHLLSIEERNYFDYYMYNTPYTNGPALRNRYVHGTNGSPNQDYKHRSAYNRLMILLILELLKIEDDLILRQSSEKEKVSEHKDDSFLLGKMAEVVSYNNPKALTSAGKHLLIPKKLGIEEGYVFLNTLASSITPAYVALVNGVVLPEYIAFLLNSSLFRLLLNSKGAKTAVLTIERIKLLELPYCNVEIQAACGKLEMLTAQLKLLETALTREERLQLNLFTNLRNYLSLELFQPAFTKENNMEFVVPFVKMMNEIYGDDKQYARQLADELMKPGNILMDNMKKARILINQRNQE